MPKAMTTSPIAEAASSRRWAAERHTLFALSSNATRAPGPQLSLPMLTLNGPTCLTDGLTGSTAAATMMMSPTAIAMKPTYLLLLN